VRLALPGSLIVLSSLPALRDCTPLGPFSTALDPLSVICDNLALVRGMDLMRMGTFIIDPGTVVATGAPPCGGP
jgi:hypothetical protein